MRPEILLRRNWIDLWPGKVNLIEPTIGSTPGFPDAFVSHLGEGGLVEFKALDSEGMIELEKTQRLWLIENLPHYSRVAIVALSPVGFYTFPAQSIAYKGMPLQHQGDRGRLSPWDVSPSSLLHITTGSWL